MATVQVASATSAQGRTPRVTTSWAPPSGVIHSRPWRSSPLAGPAFSRLPTIISESSEESHEDDLSDDTSARLHSLSRSPSWSSIDAASVAASASGYGSGYGSGNTSLSALALFDGESSASSVSLFTGTTGTSAHGGASSSQGHVGTRPARLTKSHWGRRSLPPGEMLVVPPPRARTAQHDRSRPLSFPDVPTSSSSSILPQAYSRDSRFQSDHNTHKQPPSVSRDPTSNWMSSSPFGPGTTPKFSRLSMASPAVVMPLSAKEYRKRQSKDLHGKGKALEHPSSSNHVTFSDSSRSAAIQGVPLVTVSPPPSEDTHNAHSSSSLHDDPRTTPQPHVGHAHPKPFPQQRRLTQKHKRPRPQPNAPSQPSPLSGQPPISPKSSSGTFVSFASTLDGNTPFPPTPQSASAPTDDPNTNSAVPPARPRPRLRRKSYPERVSNGARLSLLEAMDHLSQENTSLHRMSGMSQTDSINRLSVASEGSGQTLFYDIAQSDEGGSGRRMSGLRTKSLEDISTSLSVTVHHDGDGTTIKAKRNVRTVRISDTVEVSPAPVHRPRKLTKQRRGSVQGPPSKRGAVKDTEAQTQTQTHERRTSLLPWRSKASGNSKNGSVVALSVPTVSAPEKTGGDGDSPMPTKASVHSNATTSPPFVPSLPSPWETGSVRGPKISRSHSPKTSLDISRPVPVTTPDSEPESLPSISRRKSRRYSFSFLPSSAFPRSKRENHDTAHRNLDNKSKESVGHVESGTDGTSMSIRTVTQDSQSTIIPASPEFYNLTTSASSGRLAGSRRGTSSSAVPMLRRLNAQEEATPGAPLQSDSDDQGGSTPSLITNGSSGTSSSLPRTLTPPSFPGGGGLSVPRPSGLKESSTDTSEEDSDDVIGPGRNSRMCVHHRQKSPLARASLVITAVETTEEEEWVHLHPIPSVGPNLSPSSYHGSRPGTSCSSLTSATEQSESYVSFSTADPASTASSSSCSRSPSLVMGGDTRDQVASSHGDDEVYACALCGHYVPRAAQLASPASNRLEMHPMFTVPLLTVPPSTVSLVETHPRSMGRARYGGGRKSKGQVSLPSASFPLSRQSRNHVDTTAHVDVNGYLSESGTTMSTKTRAGQTAMETIDSTMTTAPLASPTKMRKRHRPQTAPAGTGGALKFIEEVTAQRAREASVDVHGIEKQDRSSKSRARGGESRFKMLLKDLLRWRR